MRRSVASSPVAVLPKRVGVLLLPPAILLGFAAQCAKPPAEAEVRPTAQSFSIATFNMNWGNVDLSDTVAVIRASGAEFVCMQETSPKAERLLRRELSSDYPHMVFLKGERFATGFALLSRAELLDVRFLEPKHGYFGALFCTVRLAGRKVLVVSVHLQPMLPEDGESFTGLLTLMAETANIHAKEISGIYSELPAKAPVILAGDFNSTSAMYVPRFLAARGFVDSFASVTEDADSHITWHWDYRGIDWRFRLDYIFHTGHFTTRESRIAEAFSSDHNLVVSKVEWAEEDPPPLPPLGEAADEEKRRGENRATGEDKPPAGKEPARE